MRVKNKRGLYCSTRTQVDHTITLYLVDPNGEFVDYYGFGKNVEDISTSVLVNIDKWNILNAQKNKWTSFLGSQLAR